MTPHQTKTCRSGKGVARGRPKDLSEEKRKLLALLGDLQAIGPAPSGVQERDPFEFPDRKGL